MKPLTNASELALVALVLTVGMFLVMWTRQPPANCTLPVEGQRRLVLNRGTDREHLAGDLAAADRIARRYILSTAKPQQSPRIVDCKARLVQEIATRHGLRPDQVWASDRTPAGSELP